MKIAFGETTVPRGRFDASTDQLWQKRIAASVTAVSGVVIFLTAREVLGNVPSFLIALLTGLSTPLWSTASRAVRTHTWVVLLFALAVYLLFRAESRGSTKALGVAIATLFAWAVFTRPTAALSAVPFSVYFLWRHPRCFTAYGVTAGAWLGAFLYANFAHFGAPWPPYYSVSSGLQLGHLRLGLTAQLVSPSRGLVVYAPLVVLVVVLVVKNLRGLQAKGLVIAVSSACLLHGLVSGSFWNWWGGECYGARYYTDLMPLLAFLATVGVKAEISRSKDDRVGWFAMAFFSLLATFGIFVNAAGSVSQAARQWNTVPVPIRFEPERVFDWSRPQFACALFPGLLERGRRGVDEPELSVDPRLR